MWVHARAAVAKWIVREDPSPEDSAERAAQQAARARAERERASQTAVAAQRAADTEAQREAADRQREVHDAFCERVKAAGVLFPGEYHGPMDRDYFNAPRRAWIGRVLNRFGL